MSRVLALDAAGPRSPLALSLPGTCERQGPGGRRPARWGPVALAGDLVLAACAPEVRAWRLGGDGATPVPTGIAHARLTRFAADASARVVVTVGLDGRLLAWRRAGGDRFTATPLPDPPLPTTALAVDAGGRWIAAAGFDHVRIWDASTAEPRAVATEPISMGLVRALAISPAGDRLVAAGERRAEGSKAGAPARRGVVRTWALEAGRPLSPADADLPGAIHAVAFDPSTGELYTGDDVDQVRRWTPAPLRGGGLVGASERAIVAIAAGRVTHPGAEGFPPAWDDARVVTADRLGNVVVRLSLDDERHAVTLLEGADLRRSLASDARGERLVVADEEVVVWDLRPRSIRDAACRLAAPPDEPGRANPCAGPMAARRE